MPTLANAFHELDTWLAKHQALWQVHGFHLLDWPWREDFPDLCQWLDTKLREDNSPSFDEVEETWQAHIAGFKKEPKSDWLTTFAKADLPDLPSYFSQGIKGRKWQQILAFSDGINVASPMVEWCAGKGHLGKILGFQHGVNVHSLEWQQALCEAGTAEAKRLHLQQTFSRTDVLKGEGRRALQQANSAVALHACGDLHRVLIEQSIEAGLKHLAISPCCYHLTQDEIYQPLSTQGKNAQTQLGKEHLKLAVKEIATAGQREQRLKQTELTYRLGFDAWQRHAQGIDQYLNVPSCPKALLTQGFAHFCHWAAEQKQLTHLLNTLSLTDFEMIGQQRSHQIALIESVSQYFRRPLELWLVLDRALRLEEEGYQVEIGEFCDKSLTPRNLLIKATR